MTPAAIVACNIYVTAASAHSATLLSLLRRAQERCRQLRQQGDDHIKCASGTAASGSDDEAAMASVAMVHAYADVPYDRSSFHLAGTPGCVSDVASGLICNALKEIDVDCNIDQSVAGQESRHPFVGLVDHVSVMPLTFPIHDKDSSGDFEQNCDAAATAAREIGKQVSNTKLVNVHYYGKACHGNTPLAKVRRERTSFFKSGGATDKGQAGQRGDATGCVAPKGDATIGTPDNFVENFNIRLTSNVTFERAKTLTQYLRGRNMSTKGNGVAGVEALTLPYVRDLSQGGKVYEVACNLTKPNEGGASAVQLQLEKWIDDQRRDLSKEGDDASRAFDYDYFVEEAYPVGTTEKQCIEVLAGKQFNNHDSGASISNERLWKEYDEAVFRRFQGYLQP